MDLQAIKFGLGIALCVIVGITVFFALYVKLSVLSTRKERKKSR